MRQIVGHGFGCINPIRNEKLWKYKKKKICNFFENYA